jgi:hypothetical protein
MSWDRTYDLTLRIDKASGSPIVTSKTNDTQVDAIYWYARDRFNLRIRFVESSGDKASPLTVLRKAASDVIVLKANSPDDLDADPCLYSATGFTETEVTVDEDWYYSAELNLNTTPGNVAVDALSGSEALLVYFDIEVQNAGNTSRRTIQFPVYIKKDAARDQGTPASGNPPYPDASILPFTFTVLTGGTATALDAIETTALTVGRIALGPDATGQGGLWQLQAGTDAEASPGIIRPDDYAGATNEKIWKRIL